jgi:DNA-binding transcriptional MerR regulator
LQISQRAYNPHQGCTPPVGETDMNVLSATSPVTADQTSKFAPVLNSWKEIAAHLGLGVRTVQRYEQEFGLPVRRLDGKHHSSVRAYPKELNSWLERRAKCLGAQTSEGQPELEGLLSRCKVATQEIRSSVQENQRLREESRFLRVTLHNSVASLRDSTAKLMRL